MPAVLLLILCFVIAAPNASALEWTGNVRLLGGIKVVNDEHWAPIDEHQEVGIAFDFRQEGWPFHVAADILYSSDDTTNTGGPIDGSTIELNLGFRRYIGHDSNLFLGFVGGGFALISSEIEWDIAGFNATSADGEGVGFWLDGGVLFRLAQHIDMESAYATPTPMPI